MDWWLSLGSPRHIVAPMVDMSELPFRILCRRHGAQLCYTPMLHAQRFIEDPNYRASHLKTCPEDRPLIVQFCANDPDTFAAAAKLAEPHCDAIDLNLGCPQVIAKRGHYGAFLQDEWDLLTHMIQTASRQISIPVTCKIRIHPDKQVTVQFAQMLEKAGCKLLVVHSRTREQKGQATGLADWEVTKTVKAALSIPVVSNGNILNFSDVEHCLEYTGADGVMSAEGILRNPALFSGDNPPVWQIAEEFLELCHQFPIEEGHVRTHLFRLFSNCLKLYSDLQEELAEANTMSKFESLSQKLKMRLQDLQQTPVTSSGDLKVISPRCDCNNESDADSDRDLICQSRDMSECPSPVTLTGCENVSDPVMQELGMVLFDKHDPQVLEDTPGSTNEVMSQKPAENLPRFLEETAGLLSGEHPAQTAYEYHLPVWLCHARPREKSSRNSGTCKACGKQATTESGTGGASGTECVHQVAAQGSTSHSSPALSKNVERKLKRYEMTLRGRRMKRKRKKEERKQRKAEENSQANDTQDDLTERLSKLQMKTLTNEKCRAAMATGQRICIDLSMDEFMTQKECSKLAQQLGRLYGANKKSPSPAHLYFTGLNKQGHIYTECVRKHQGFQEFMVDMHESSHLDVFKSSHIVFLSPDSPNVLTDLDQEKVYVIGGLVDEQVNKHVTLSRAQDAQISTARLPLMEYMERNQSGTFNQILAVNQVFEILLKFLETKDWRKALEVGVPKRKGFTLKQTHTSNTTCSENVEFKTYDKEPS